MKQVIWVIVVLLVIWGVYALATGGSKTDEGNDPQTEEVATSTPETAVNMIDVVDQKPGKEVVVASYTLSAPGYIVIHKVGANDAPGDVWGNSELLPAGTAMDAKVTLSSATKDGEKVNVMLHIDNGDGKYDTATDAPATATDATGGQAVVMKTVMVKK